MPRKRKFDHHQCEFDSLSEFIFDSEDFPHEISHAVSDIASADGRRVTRALFPIYVPPSPKKRVVREEDLEDRDDEHLRMSLDNDAERHQIPLPPPTHKCKNMYYSTSEHDPCLKEWSEDRDGFVAEMLRLDGLRGCLPRCNRCSKSEGEVLRCMDCSDGDALWCTECCILSHSRLPFHVIKRWNGRYFVSTMLRDLGLVVQLGHRVGDTCRNPVDGPVDFMVIHTNGIHPVSVKFCQCDQVSVAGDHIQQLLRFELYPATLTEPTTCGTFRMMETFHLLTLQSKIPGYDYYITLNNLTDNTGITVTWDRVKQFMRMVREWRNLKMLKRGSRGHEAGGVAITKPGELCVLCPACPRPEINLPENWEDAPSEMKYIYTLLIAVDANFRLKRRAISSDQRDPALGTGWGYFVEDVPYREHVLRYADQQDISTCTGFKVLVEVNTKYSKGYAATGVGMAVCARHGFILPNAVGDLQKGERYCNMDYIIASTLSLRGKYTRTIISYDIVCQWARNFKDRIKEFPHHLQIELPDDLGQLRYAIPKYHFCAHKEKGHNQYSLNLMSGVGRSCGEQIERNWPKHSETAASTREMGPGSRHDTLEDHFRYANWRVLVNLGNLLHHQHAEAIKDSAVQEVILAEFTARLQDENVTAWIAEADRFDQNPSKKDPYYRESEGLTEAQIRLQLAEEDDQAAESGEMSLHDVTPASMLVEMLEIEDTQRRFKQRYPKSMRSGTNAATAHQSGEMTSKRAALRRRLLNLRSIQAIYMPSVPQLLARYICSLSSNSRSDSANAFPEDQPLFFPHQLSLEDLEKCASGLPEIEERLRDAQLHESLDRLCVHLHIKARLVTFKNRNVRHQGSNTRARWKIEINESKIVSITQKYQAARAAKLELARTGPWAAEYKELALSDIRTLLQVEDPIHTIANGATSGAVSEGRRTTSWIWMAADKHGDGGAINRGMQDAVRVEFLRARAQALRFREHIQMLKEEKQRVLVTLEHDTSVWGRREIDGTLECTVRGQGKAAYAAKQVDIRRRLAKKFAGIWEKLPAVDASCAISAEGVSEPITYTVEATQSDESDASDEDIGTDVEE